jgi:hypothetical protein
MPPRNLNAPFGRLTLTDVNRLLGAALSGFQQRVSSRWHTMRSALSGWTPISISRAFLAGEHWQGNWGWIGPRPQPTDPAYTETMDELERQFVSKNVIGEMVGRHVNGVLGIEPSWGLSPLEAVPEGEDIPEGTQRLIDEAEAALTAWWDSRQMGRLLQEVCTTLLYAERAMLRLYVPRGLLVENTALDAQSGAEVRTLSIEAASFEDALNHIWPDHPLPEYSTVAQDDETKQYVGVVYFQRAESMIAGRPATEEHADLTYLDGDRSEPETVIRTVTGNLSVEFRFDLNGLLPMYEAERPLFVTPQLWQAQRALNLALTLLPRSVTTSGFLERTIFNAQMPGEWETDADGRRVRFVPAPYYVGAGVTNILRGIELEDPQNPGRTQIATPSIHHREPSDTAPVIDAARAHYLDMLEEGSQEHVLAIQQAAASGKTHEQARATFITSLRLTTQQIEPMGRWLISTLLAMGEAFSGETGKYTDVLRPYFACHLDAGPISTEERTANENAVKAGTMSRQTAILRNGEVDPDAELARINAQPDASLGIIERQTTVIKTLTDAGANLRGAAAFAGLDDEQIETLLALPANDDPDSPENQPQGDPVNDPEDPQIDPAPSAGDA